MPTLPLKVAVSREHTGNAAADRAQRVAQKVAVAHEQTKDYVAALEQTVAALSDEADALETRLAIAERTTGVGRTSFAMGNVNYTATAAQAACQFLVLTGAHTGVRTLTMPAATDATAYLRWIVNITTGGFAVTVTTPTGGVASVANGATKAVLMSNAATSVVT